MYKVKVRNKFVKFDDHYKMIINHKKHGIVECLIDLDDFNKVYDFNWFANFDKTINGFYICHKHRENGKSVSFKMHRLITNCPENLVVDHINHITTDNRKCNLRICTQFANKQNGTQNKSGKIGVSFNKHYNIWQPYISVKNKRVWLKECKTFEEAVTLRKHAELNIHNFNGVIECQTS